MNTRHMRGDWTIGVDRESDDSLGGFAVTIEEQWRRYLLRKERQDRINKLYRSAMNKRFSDAKRDES